MEENKSGADTSINNTDKINEAVTAAVSNPELISNVMNLLGKSVQNESNEDDKKASASNPLTDINPDIVKMLPSIISALAPVMNTVKSSQSQTESPENSIETENKIPEKPAEESSSTVSGGRIGNLISIGRHEKLLRAIEPYLSVSKQNAVEHLIQISRITDVMGNLDFTGHSGTK